MTSRRKSTNQPLIDDADPEGLQYVSGDDKRQWRTVAHDSLVYTADLPSGRWFIMYLPLLNPEAWAVYRSTITPGDNYEHVAYSLDAAQKYAEKQDPTA